MSYPNPLMNNPPKVKTGFNASGYEQFFIDNFRIINKAKNAVDFKPNPPQHSLNLMLETFFDILVLKARKMGFSSDALAVGATKFLMGQNEKCVSMSFDQEASDKQLGRAKYYIKSYEEKNQIKIPYKYNSKNQMVWEGRKANDKGGYDHFENVLQVGTAKNTSFGRGDDISFLHLTEVSLADVDLLMAGVGEACLPKTHKILETTANGFNTYKEFWDKAMRGEIDFAALFYSPLWEYTKEFIDKKYKDLGRLAAQEYPMTPKMAFLTSGLPYFDQEAMLDYEEQTANRKPIMSQLPRDMFKQFRHLQKGEFILVFIDTAGEGSDYNAGQFLSADYLDIPVTLHYKGSIVDVTPKLKTVLNWIYKETGVKPVVAYETNNGGGYELQRLDRLNTYQYYRMYCQYVLDPVTKKLKRTDKLGWNTNSANRSPMLDGVEEVINNKMVNIYDQTTVGEMFSFVRVKTPTSWRAQAEVGAYDDHIMSLAGVWQLYQTEKPTVEKKHVNRPRPTRARFHV